MFYVFIGFVIMERLLELAIARRNEMWMKGQGALEYGQNHYRFMVLMHLFFFVSIILEKLFFHREISPYWPLLLVVFFLLQLGRVWVITSLGRYWNTKIIVLPNAEVIRKGPYRFIKHPNYFVVTLELVVIPLLVEAYLTALSFTLLNMVMLAIRIPAEERALKGQTGYEESFQGRNRFLPKVVK